MMNFISKKFLGVMAALAIFALPALAEVGVGVDAVSKYVWRGTAVGSGVAIQPSVDLGLSSEGGLFAEGSTTLGLWGSYSLVNAVNDEINIALSQGLGFATLSVTDYYFPGAAGTGAGNSFFEFADDGGHALEVGVSVDVANASLFVGRFVSGATKDDTYAELSYPLSDDLSLVLGVGDGALAAEGDFALVNAGLAVTSDSGYGASFTVNPDAETAYLVVSKSW
jgi:hypothetical protein|tara:strand:+ start:527 stop:1198 length:672 start_codon:yes stop_codon:yes gene_type:complete